MQGAGVLQKSRVTTNRNNLAFISASSLGVSEITQVYQQNKQTYNEMSDEVAEWLRRWTANPMCSARVGSNPILVVSIIYIFSESTVYSKRFAEMVNIQLSLFL